MRREVRRYPRSTSGRRFTPATLNGLRLWLRADLGITLNGGNVSAWANQAPGAHDATQATAAKQPAYSLTSLNSRPGITFDGSDDCLQIASLTHGGSDKVTVAFVAKDTSGGVVILAETGADVNNAGWSVIPQAAVLAVRSQEPGSAHNTGDMVETLANPRRIIFTADRAIVGGVGTLEVAAWKDGVSQVLSQTGNANTTGNFADQVLNIGSRNNGGSLAWAGTLGEFIMYNRLLSATEIAQLDGYLKARWGL